MTTPVRILHLHSSFSLGGKEARAVRLMNAFGDRARHVVVSGVPGQYGARDAIAKGIRYEIAQDPPPLTGKPSVARYEAIARFMSRFDLVLTYNWGAVDGVMARRVFSKGMPPVVHHEDGFNSDEAERLNPVRNMYRRFALPAAHALVVPSARLHDIARRVWKQPERRVHRIVNGVAVDRYAAPPSPTAIPGFRRRKGATVIGTLAGLRPVKDLTLLVRAVGGVGARVQLVIVGEGPERQAILDAAAAMAIDDVTVLPGFLPEPWRYMGLFDIFALTSQSEQQPIAVIEAMAAGLPVVAPRLGDIPTMVAEDNLHYLSPDRSEVHIRDRIQTLAQHPDHARFVGERNRERARALFDESLMIERYARLYGEAMGRPEALL